MTQRMIVLEYDGYQAPVYLQNERSERSVHSGRDLRRIQGTLQATGQDIASAFQAAIRAGAPIEGVDTRTRVRSPWRVEIPGYSSSDDRYSFSVTLHEAENLQADVLVLDGNELVPLRYEEQAYGEGIQIQALVRVEGESLAAVRKHIKERDYFPIVRKGVSEAPVEMRFGMCGWSEDGDARLYRLILVDRRSGKEERDPHIVDYERSARRNTLLFRAELLERLLQRLVAKGVLSREEVDELKREAQDGLSEREENLLHVPDAEKLAW